MQLFRFRKRMRLSLFLIHGLCVFAFLPYRSQIHSVKPNLHPLPFCPTTLKHNVSNLICQCVEINIGINLLCWCTCRSPMLLLVSINFPLLFTLSPLLNNSS
ncbi:hypothetical protein E2542_SST01492 [Spatholobus suberectus]|nr:hypothetical protein E2542_SST01492 [Spatholobus suberectus]